MWTSRPYRPHLWWHFTLFYWNIYHYWLLAGIFTSVSNVNVARFCQHWLTVNWTGCYLLSRGVNLKRNYFISNFTIFGYHVLCHTCITNKTSVVAWLMVNYFSAACMHLRSVNTRRLGLYLNCVHSTPVAWLGGKDCLPQTVDFCCYKNSWCITCPFLWEIFANAGFDVALTQWAEILIVRRCL